MTREEAINTVRNIYQTDKEKEALEILIPELAESEDERIINAIISFLRMTSLYSSNGCKKPEMITWLEKQKEQKPLTTEETELNSIAFLEQMGYTCIPPGKEQKPTEKQDYSGLNDFERAIHRGFLSTGVENVPVTIIKETANECLARMKPAEWSEVDEHYLNSVINLVHGTNDGAWGSCIGDRIENWLESLPERFNLQPKKEWSEEDIKRIRSEEYTKGFNDAAFGSKLKEWSVEDEDRIRQIERIAQEAGCTQKLQEEIHDWLKSLRPSWKPSEEQMKALDKAIPVCMGVVGRDEIAPLESLYEQLQKL